MRQLASTRIALYSIYILCAANLMQQYDATAKHEDCVYTIYILFAANIATFA
jgi:hypothetical protein